MDPAIWGPHLWKSIHYIALGYPDIPSMTDKYNYKLFYESIHKILPCEKCAEHYKMSITNNPVDTFLDSPKSLFEWTVLIHNEANKHLGKPTIPFTKAKKLYMKQVETFKNPDNSSTLALMATTTVCLCIIIATYTYMRRANN